MRVVLHTRCALLLCRMTCASLDCFPPLPSSHVSYVSQRLPNKKFPLSIPQIKHAFIVPPLIILWAHYNSITFNPPRVTRVHEIRFSFSRRALIKALMLPNLTFAITRLCFDLCRPATNQYREHPSLAAYLQLVSKISVKSNCKGHNNDSFDN